MENVKFGNVARAGSINKSALQRISIERRHQRPNKKTSPGAYLFIDYLRAYQKQGVAMHSDEPRAVVGVFRIDWFGKPQSRIGLTCVLHIRGSTPGNRYNSVSTNPSGLA